MLVAERAVAYIVEIYGGRKPYIPMLQAQRKARNRSIIAAIQSGHSIDRIAQLHGINPKSVQRLLDRAAAGAAPIFAP